MNKITPAIGLLALLTGARFHAALAEQDTGFVAAVPAAALTVSTYYNEDVYDNQNNKIGDVDDILLEKDGRGWSAIPSTRMVASATAAAPSDTRASVRMPMGLFARSRFMPRTTPAATAAPRRRVVSIRSSVMGDAPILVGGGGLRHG